MLMVTDPKCKVITVMSCTQILKTELINNIVGYFIHQDPSPIAVMQPTKSLAETWSKERFDKMVRDTPSLTQLVQSKRRGESDNTMYNKTFPGGQVVIVWSQSPSELASRPIRVVLCDEVDKYPLSAGKEGDPIKLIEERTDTFWNALKVRVCSPTIEGQSRIDEEYQLGDQRTYHGLCPHCDEYEDLRWQQIRYDEADVEGSTAYECSHCTALWNDQERINAIAKGKYIAKKPFAGHASFKVNKIASPWNALSELVKKFIDAKGNTEKLKTFYNTQLAETWKVKSDSPDHMRLYDRRETYAQNHVNSKTAFLTCGVDVQANRLELEIVAWGKDKQSWSIDYRIIPGQTATEAPWKELDKLLQETWVTEDKRQLKLQMLCVDTGYNTQHVYNWVRKQDPLRVRAIKGYDHLSMMFSKPTSVELNYSGKTIKNALQIWPIGVSVVKGELYSWLKMDGPIDGEEKPGYCHFPQYDETYFLGLCSEQLVQKRHNGRTANMWEKKYERNEPLDTRVYARVAASMFGMDRFSDEEWQILLENISIDEPQNNDKIDNNKDNTDFWNDSGGRGSRGSGNRGFW